MRTYKKCLLCFERQAADVCVMSKLDEKQTQTVLHAVRAKIKTFSCNRPPIEMAVDIHDLIRSYSGMTDPYSNIKKEANNVCQKCVPELTRIIARSLTPMKTAVQLAIAGNIIDCGAYGLRAVARAKMLEIIENALAQPLHGDDVDDFKCLINHAKQILYIGDNAGECFFDVSLLKLIPSGKLTYAVRGGPVLNDATIEDARTAGINRICRLIDTGDNAPGILLERCSNEFRHFFEKSDLIISKGQGNYESLSETTNKAIVFLTKVKCEVIADDIGYPLDSNVIKICGPTTNNISEKPEIQKNKTKTEVRHA